MVRDVMVRATHGEVYGWLYSWKAVWGGCDMYEGFEGMQ